MKQETIDKIEQHYNHACTKHPDFVKRFGVEDEFDWSEFNLKMYRTKIETETKYNNLGLESILLCEVWEFFDAIANERFQEAIEEGYDIIAVVLRVIERIKRLAVAENATTTPTCDKSSQVGNAAALRVALINVQTLIKVLSRCHANDLPTAVKSILGDIAFRVSEALAAPPRNCDVMSLDTAKKVWFAKEIVPRLNGDLPLGKEVPFEEWFVSQHEKRETNEQ